jgi:hypothetical protein
MMSITEATTKRPQVATVDFKLAVVILPVPDTDLIERDVDVSEVFHGLAFSDTAATHGPGPDPGR